MKANLIWIDSLKMKSASRLKYFLRSAKIYLFFFVVNLHIICFYFISAYVEARIFELSVSWAVSNCPYFYSHALLGQVLRAVRIYASDLYGAMLYDLSSPASESNFKQLFRSSSREVWHLVRIVARVWIGERHFF